MEFEIEDIAAIRTPEGIVCIKCWGDDFTKTKLGDIITQNDQENGKISYCIKCEEHI